MQNKPTLIHKLLVTCPWSMVHDPLTNTRALSLSLCLPSCRHVFNSSFSCPSQSLSACSFIQVVCLYLFVCINQVGANFSALGASWFAHPVLWTSSFSLLFSC